MTNKCHILKICKLAFTMFGQKRMIVLKDELPSVLDKNDIERLGFIERSNLSHQHQFVHPLMMKFCASVHLLWYENFLITND